MPKRGLPAFVSMRHDEHYVEALAMSAGTPVGRMVAIDLIDPNPNQPRQVMGDLSELIASIARKGDHRAARRAAARRAVPDHRRRAPLPGVGPGRAARAAGRRPRGRRHRGHRARADREPAAEGPDAVRRGGGAAGARRALRVYARGPGAAAGEVAHVGHRVPVAGGHARRDPEPVSAGRHFH